MPADRKPLKFKTKKALITLIATFFAIQVILDLAHSVTAYPFEHYGMFTESFSAPDSLTTYEIVADGRRLDAANFGIYRWDMLQQPLAAFDRQSSTSDFAFDRSRIKAVFPGMYSRFSANLENNATVAASFPDWYLHYLGRLLHQSIHSFRVNRCRYQVLQNQLILIQRMPWINR
jgi:predicted metalloprotease with PDZ domain